jgi:hypothetical protein
VQTVTDTGMAQQADVSGTQSVDAGQDLIPINPYTVSTTKPRNTNTLPVYQNKQSTVAPPKPHAIRQPDSGPEVWVAVLLSICALLFLTRKQLRGYTA